MAAKKAPRHPLPARPARAKEGAKVTSQAVSTAPLPALPSIEEIQRRLKVIFPESFPDRGILVGQMAARVAFVFLYGGFVEGQDRYLRPSFIYFFTEDQAARTADEERKAWLTVAHKAGYRPEGRRWYADNSRETIRDDLMRNELHDRLGVLHHKPGVPTTASTPIHFLDAAFAALFDPALTGQTLEDGIEAWRQEALDPATLSRMALKAQGVQAKLGDVLIDLPDGTRIRISAGPSAEIAKGLIEDFATLHLTAPAVLWLSASDKKSYPQFVERAAAVGLKFDVGAELPDVILADLERSAKFYFCEIVATDGAVTDERRQALLAIVRASDMPESSVTFVTAFEDRESGPFRKNFSRLAIQSMVWFRTEPHLLVLLTEAARKELAGRDSKP